LKRYQNESGGLAPFTVWGAAEVGDTSSAKKALLRQFPDRPAFDTPKPLALLERIVEIATDPGELVLDFYLGSGTTAVAAQRLGRPWVGVEKSSEVVEAFVLPRLQAAYNDGARAGFGISRMD
jgi:adenine-specific DNA-methyltransferase